MRIHQYLIAIAMLASLGCSKQTPVQEISIADSGIVMTEAANVSVDLPWPQWRGTNQGVAPQSSVVTQWGEDNNVRWQVDVPGRGHSSPIVVGDLVVLGTATRQPDQQWMIAYDRHVGSERWSSVIHSDGFPSDRDVHNKATHANATVASNGSTFVTAHLNKDHVWVTALDGDGKQVWQTDIGAFNSKFGYAPSPVIYKSLVIVAADNQGGGYLVALDVASGEIAWRRSRGPVSTYSSPAVVTLDGTDQIVITGGEKMASYSPATGEPIWQTDCIADATCGTVVTANNRVFGSGGWPANETVCLDSSGNRVWSNRTKVYEPSMVTDGENLFAISDDGIAYCWAVEDGNQRWKKRLGGNFSASPVICNGNVYAADLSGNTYVFKASGEAYELVSKNRLGDDCYASPAIAGDAIFLRVGFGQGADRSEKLTCIAMPTN